MIKSHYSSAYQASRALIIGINKYQNVGNLSYAVNDAEEFASVLSNSYGFNNSNIVILKDQEATNHNIQSEYAKWAGGSIGDDDRLIFFYAGHGHTINSRYGEIGFLVPFDGDPNSLSTLIPWQTLTKNAEIFKPKHMLFVMDACYGGLAFTRAALPGSMRFVKDMMTRYSRQVLTAGKANETVSDSGGPIPNHSVFTGHLIEALGGKAKSPEGLVTANGVMSYVYEKVSNDSNSHQTPHYGHIDGDGDFIFNPDLLLNENDVEIKDKDFLISVPTSGLKTNKSNNRGLVEIAKEYLSEDRNRIKLYELVQNELRATVLNLRGNNFPINDKEVSVDSINERLTNYENHISNILQISISISFWAKSEHFSTLTLPISRINDTIDQRSGTTIWLEMRNYPLLLLSYAIGISIIANGIWNPLKTLFFNKHKQQTNQSEVVEFIVILGNIITLLNQHKVFEAVPGYSKKHTPMSEYIYKYLQPIFDDLLFLGSNYEQVFDSFEIMLCLVHFDLDYQKDDNHSWGPIGRFGWKNRLRGNQNTFNIFVDEAIKLGSDWEPLKIGFFGGNHNRFKKAVDLATERLNNLSWF